MLLFTPHHAPPPPPKTTVVPRVETRDDTRHDSGQRPDTSSGKTLTGISKKMSVDVEPAGQLHAKQTLFMNKYIWFTNIK